MSSTLTKLLHKTNIETDIVGQKVQLRHKSLSLANAELKAISGQIQRAEGLVSATISQLNSGLDATARGYAATYFLTEPTGPDAGQLATIKRVLELTHHGLISDFTLKLGGEGDLGFVRKHRMKGNRHGQGIEWSTEWVQPGWKTHIITSPHDGKTYTRDGHAMHVSKTLMISNADKAVLTLIHEASHKFGDTWDHGWKGYRKRDDSDWNEKGLCTHEALRNADSYAYFAFHVGKTYGW